MCLHEVYSVNSVRNLTTISKTRLSFLHELRKMNTVNWLPGWLCRQLISLVSFAVDTPWHSNDLKLEHSSYSYSLLFSIPIPVSQTQNGKSSQHSVLRSPFHSRLIRRSTFGRLFRSKIVWPLDRDRSVDRSVGSIFPEISLIQRSNQEHHVTCDHGQDKQSTREVHRLSLLDIISFQPQQCLPHAHPSNNEKK